MKKSLLLILAISFNTHALASPLLSLKVGVNALSSNRTLLCEIDGEDVVIKQGSSQHPTQIKQPITWSHQVPWPRAILQLMYAAALTPSQPTHQNPPKNGLAQVFTAWVPNSQTGKITPIELKRMIGDSTTVLNPSKPALTLVEFMSENCETVRLKLKLR